MNVTLKNKYLDMIASFWGGIGKDSISYSGNIKDSEGEEIYVSYGSLPITKSLHLDYTALEFISASLFLKAKKEGKEIPFLEEAIHSLLFRRDEIETIQLEHSRTTSFVSVANFKTNVYPDYLNFYYEEFAIYLVGSFNSFYRILAELKGEIVENYFSNEKIFYLDLDNVNFDKKYFFNLYKKQVNDFLNKFELGQHIDLEQSYYNCSEEEYEQLKNHSDKEVEELKKLINAELSVLERLLFDLPSQ